MLRPMGLRAYFLWKLPLALAAGVRLDEVGPDGCTTSVPYGWRTTNPFRSMYFAAQAMAAELSTGALTLLATRSAEASIATLITGLEASFEKKADGRVTFTCDDGAAVFAAVRTTIATGEPVAVPLETVGRLPDGTPVSRFTFTWSMKVRSQNSEL